MNPDEGYKLSFVFEGEEVGTLDFSQGTMAFKGNVEVSAKLLCEMLAQLWAKRLWAERAPWEEQVKKLQHELALYRDMADLKVIDEVNDLMTRAIQ